MIYSAWLLGDSVIYAVSYNYTLASCTIHCSMHTCGEKVIVGIDSVVTFAVSKIVSDDFREGGAIRASQGEVAGDIAGRGHDASKCQKQGKAKADKLLSLSLSVLTAHVRPRCLPTAAAVRRNDFRSSKVALHAVGSLRHYISKKTHFRLRFP